MKSFISTTAILTLVLIAFKILLGPDISWLIVFIPVWLALAIFITIATFFFIHEILLHYWPEKAAPISRWLVSFYKKKMRKTCKEGKCEFPIVCDACEHFMLYGASGKAACDLGHKTKYFMFHDRSGYYAPESETCQDYE